MSWIQFAQSLSTDLRNASYTYLEEIMEALSLARNPRLSQHSWEAHLFYSVYLPEMSREEFLNQNQDLLALTSEWEDYHNRVKDVQRTLDYLNTTSRYLEQIITSTVQRLTRDYDKQQQEKLSKLRRTITDNNVLQKKQREIYAQIQEHHRKAFPEETELRKMARELQHISSGYYRKGAEIPSPREKEIFDKVREFCRKYPTPPVPYEDERTHGHMFYGFDKMQGGDKLPGSMVTNSNALDMLEAQRNYTFGTLKGKNAAVSNYKISPNLERAFDYAARLPKLDYYEEFIRGLRYRAGYGMDDVWDNQSPLFDKNTLEYQNLQKALRAMEEKIRTLRKVVSHKLSNQNLDVQEELARIHEAALPFKGTKLAEALTNLGTPEEEFRKHAAAINRQDRNAVKNFGPIIEETPAEKQARLTDGPVFHQKLISLLDIANSYKTKDGTLAAELKNLRECLEDCIENARMYSTADKRWEKLADITCAGYLSFTSGLTSLYAAVQPFKGTELYTQIMSLSVPASEYAFAQRVINAEALFLGTEPRKITCTVPNPQRKVFPENGTLPEREYNENEALFRFQVEESEDLQPELPAETPELDEYLSEITEYRTLMESHNHIYSWNSDAYLKLVESLNALEAAARENQQAAKDPEKTDQERFMANAKAQDARREVVACAKAYYTEKLKEDKNPTRMARFMLAEQLMGLGDAQAEFARRHMPPEPKKALDKPVQTESTIDSIRRTLSTLEMQDAQHPGRRTDAPMYEFDDQAKAASKVLQALDAKEPGTLTDKERTAIPMLRGIVNIQKIFKGEEEALTRQRDLADPNRQRKGLNLGLELTPTMQRDLILAASLRNVMAKHPGQREKLFASMGDPVKSQEVLRSHLQGKDAKLYQKVVTEKKKEQEAQEKALKESAERAKAKSAKQSGPAIK